MTPEQEEALVHADEACAEDLRTLQASGLGEGFQEVIGAIPDPDTDGKEHD